MQPPTHSPTAEACNGLRILLVEHNAGDAALVRGALADQAAVLQLAHVETLSQADERLADGGVDVVLLDLSLPDVTGLEGIEHLHRARPDLAIVVLTGIEDDALGARAVQAGAQDYLVKGQADGWLLLRAMRYAIERQQLHAARLRLLAQEHEARVAAEARQQRLAFVADATLRLAGTPDAGTFLVRLDEVVALAVPQFADCAIVTRPRSGTSGLLALRHVAPEKEALTRALYRAVAAPLPADEDAALGVCSRIEAPIDASDPGAGTITLLYTVESGRRHSPDDLAMLRDLARSAHLAAENVRMHEETRRAVNLREEFVAIASHELRTPLSTLILQINALRRGLEGLSGAPGTGLLATLAKADRQVGRLEHLVDALLDVAHSAQGDLTLQREPLDLARLARDLIERFAEQAKHAGCALDLRAPEPVLGVWDRLRVEQILTNLLSNAVKYGGGKPVVVTVASLDGVGTLSVRDQGIGVAPADLSRIFERFERAASARQFGGLGLGLHIARELAVAHGGSIHVTSALGEGSTFVLRLPLPAAETPESPEETSGRSSAPPGVTR